MNKESSIDQLKEKLNSLPNKEEYLNTLDVIVQLMLEINNPHLDSAEYVREFICDRLKIRVIIEKKFK